MHANIIAQECNPVHATKFYAKSVSYIGAVAGRLRENETSTLPATTGWSDSRMNLMDIPSLIV